MPKSKVFPDLRNPRNKKNPKILMMEKQKGKEEKKNIKDKNAKENLKNEEKRKDKENENNNHNPKRKKMSHPPNM